MLIATLLSLLLLSDVALALLPQIQPPYLELTPFPQKTLLLENLPSDMRAYLQRHHLHPNLQIKSSRQQGSFFVKENFLFHLNGIPLCDEHYLQVVKSDKIHFAIGRLPTYETANTELPSLAAVMTHLRTFKQGKITVLASQPCLKLEGAELIPIWELQLRVNGVRHFVQADAHQVYRWLRNDLQVMRYAQVHYPNIYADAQMVKVNVNHAGQLRNDYFVAQTSISLAEEDDDREISYDIDDPRYEALAGYYFANVMLDFFQRLGYRWHSDMPVQLFVQPAMPDRPASARYEPPSSSSGARIVIAKGRGLRNLATDFDVIAHEFAHHVIYRHVHAKTFDSVALHEGLADYFTYAKTGDNCLAESVCTDYLQGCSVPSQCLRHAEAEGNIDDFEHHHQRGEILSSLLWELHARIPNMARIVYMSLEMLSRNADQHELAQALMQSDRQLFNGQHACIIKDAFTARGVDLPFVCESYMETASLTAISPDSESTLKSQSCATLAAQHDYQQFASLLLLLLVPLCFGKLLLRVRT